MEERFFHVRRYLQCRNVRSIGSSWFRFARHAVVPSDLSGRPHHRVEMASWGAGRENPEAAGRAAPRARLRGHADRLLVVKPPRRIYLASRKGAKSFRTVHKLFCFSPTRPGFFCPFCPDGSFVGPADSDPRRFRQRNVPPGRNTGEKRPGRVPWLTTRFFFAWHTPIAIRGAIALPARNAGYMPNCHSARRSVSSITVA